MRTPPPLPPPISPLPPTASGNPPRWPAFAMLFLFFPVGLIFIWLNKSFTPKEKKVWSFVGLSLLILIVVPSAPSRQPSNPESRGTQQAEPIAPAFHFEKGEPKSYSSEPLVVEISAVAAGKGNQIIVEGKTNLPDGMPLRVRVRNLLSEMSASAQVKGGVFSAGPLPKNEAIAHGSYLLEITTPSETAMPRVVRQRVGRDCENLSGGLMEVDKSPSSYSFKRVRLLSTFMAGDQVKGDKALADELVQAGGAARAALTQAERLHQQLAVFYSERMNAAYGNSEDELAECFKRSRELQQAVKTWKLQTEKIFETYPRVDGLGEFGEVGNPLRKIIVSLEFDSQTLGFSGIGPMVLRTRDQDLIEKNHSERVGQLSAATGALKKRLDPRFNELRMTDFR